MVRWNRTAYLIIVGVEMDYRVEVWNVSEPERILEVSKHLAEFGVAIAWIRTHIFTGTLPQWQGKEIVDIGLIMPYNEKDLEGGNPTYRAFNEMLFSISEKEEVPFCGSSITMYKTPISPYAPGDGGLIELKDCLYVPPNFHSIDEQ